MADIFETTPAPRAGHGADLAGIGVTGLVVGAVVNGRTEFAGPREKFRREQHGGHLDEEAIIKHWAAGSEALVELISALGPNINKQYIDAEELRRSTVSELQRHNGKRSGPEFDISDKLTEICYNAQASQDQAWQSAISGLDSLKRGPLLNLELDSKRLTDTQATRNDLCRELVEVTKISTSFSAEDFAIKLRNILLDSVDVFYEVSSGAQKKATLNFVNDLLSFEVDRIQPLSERENPLRALVGPPLVPKRSSDDIPSEIISRRECIIRCHMWLADIYKTFERTPIGIDGKQKICDIRTDRTWRLVAELAKQGQDTPLAREALVNPNYGNRFRVLEVIQALGTASNSIELAEGSSKTWDKPRQEALAALKKVVLSESQTEDLWSFAMGTFDDFGPQGMHVLLGLMIQHAYESKFVERGLECVANFARRCNRESATEHTLGGTFESFRGNALRYCHELFCDSDVSVERRYGALNCMLQIESDRDYDYVRKYLVPGFSKFPEDVKVFGTLLKEHKIELEPAAA